MAALQADRPDSRQAFPPPSSSSRSSSSSSHCSSLAGMFGAQLFELAGDGVEGGRVLREEIRIGQAVPRASRSRPPAPRSCRAAFRARISACRKASPCLAAAGRRRFAIAGLRRCRGGPGARSRRFIAALGDHVGIPAGIGDPAAFARPCGVRRDHRGHRAVEEIAVVADQQDGSRKARDQLLQQVERLHVEIVGRLVEDQQVGGPGKRAGEQQPRLPRRPTIRGSACAPVPA